MWLARRTENNNNEDGEEEEKEHRPPEKRGGLSGKAQRDVDVAHDAHAPKAGGAVDRQCPRVGGSRNFEGLGLVPGAQGAAEGSERWAGPKWEKSGYEKKRKSKNKIKRCRASPRRWESGSGGGQIANVQAKGPEVKEPEEDRCRHSSVRSKERL